ncbi:MAG: mechanosensitive ion channel family protein [Bryobacteraceae bacterium]
MAIDQPGGSGSRSPAADDPREVPQFRRLGAAVGGARFKITISAVALAAVLSSWGYNTTPVMAGLGVGGVALALAAQKTIENLFGGVAVITDRPVAVGDFCKFGDLVGTVEDIGLRSTRVRTLNRTSLTVPNSLFSSMTLENFSKRDKTVVPFDAESTPRHVGGAGGKLLDSTTQALQQHPKVEVGSLPVRFVGVGTYSLDVEIFAYDPAASIVCAGRSGP